jgi:hypothetical protein
MIEYDIKVNENDDEEVEKDEEDEEDEDNLIFADDDNIKNWAGDEQGAGMVMNNMPEYCSVLAGNAYVAAGAMPRYVGTPERGGYWVEAKDYDAAFQAYTEKLNKAAEDAVSNQTMN